jgi:hypothetical protein
VIDALTIPRVSSGNATPLRLRSPAFQRLQTKAGKLQRALKAVEAEIKHEKRMLRGLAGLVDGQCEVRPGAWLDVGAPVCLAGSEPMQEAES